MEEGILHYSIPWDCFEHVNRSSDHIADAMSYVVPTLTGNHAETKKETIMSKLFEMKPTIRGAAATNFTDDEIFTLIAETERDVSDLQKTVAKPVKLQEKIKAMQSEIEALVEYVDSRTV